jgi:hypothetical protein
VVAVFQEGRCDGGAVGVGYATSHDTGRTWIGGDMPFLTLPTGGPFDRGDDPSVAFGPDGAVYVAEMGFDARNGCRSAVAVQRSDDRGITFGPPSFVQDHDCTQFHDKPWTAVDTFPSSPFFGRIYVAWTFLGKGIRLVIRHSDDRGQSWSHLSTVMPSGLPEGALPLVQPNGDLTVLYRDGYPFGPVKARTSADGGLTFGHAVTVSDVVGQEPRDLRTGEIEAGAVDPITGVMYAVWQDARFNPRGVNDIVISRSADGGATWNAPRQVSPSDGGRILDRFTPAVAAYGGALYVTYLTRQRAPGRNNTVYANAVTGADPGLFFGAEVTLGPPGDLVFAARSGHDKFLGDYMGVAASADGAQAVWCLPRPEPGLPRTRHQAAWSANITL